MALIKKFRIKSFKAKKPVIKVENISLSFKNRIVLENINFSLNQGQILGLFNNEIAITNFFFCPPDNNLAGTFVTPSNSN